MLDIILSLGIGLIAMIVFWKKFGRNESMHRNIAQRTDEDILGRNLKKEGVDVLILHASETRSAEEYAYILSKSFSKYGKKAVVLDGENLFDFRYYDLQYLENVLFILCLGTFQDFREESASDGAGRLAAFLKQEEIDLTKLKYAVFETRNGRRRIIDSVPKICDERLEQLGGQRVYEMGWADENEDTDDGFRKWRDALLPAAAAQFGWELNLTGEQPRQYQFRVLNDIPSDQLFSGEIGRLNSHKRQYPFSDKHKPLYAKVKVNRELHGAKSDRSCRHIEFDLGYSGLSYQAGDYLGVYAKNDEKQVDKMCSLLSIDPDHAFTLDNLDENSKNKHPFPCPTTFRVALTNYLDLSAPVKAHVLEDLAEYASDDKEKERLLELSSDPALFNDYIIKQRRSLIDVLEEFTSCKPPVELILELLPRLQARYFVISSSSGVDKKSVSITVDAVSYAIGERKMEGVCSSFLKSAIVGDSVPIFKHPSVLSFPNNAIDTILLIGSGTGIAAFRGIIQDRKRLMHEGMFCPFQGGFTVVYECSHPEVDFLYKEELEQYKKEGVISHLITAFSAVKETVRDRLVEHENLAMAAIDKGRIVVCGGAPSLVGEVKKTLDEIIGKKKNCSEEKAQRRIEYYEKGKQFIADVW